MEPGALLAGKYRVDRVLGQGGMGVVVQATHLQLGTPVAVKFLLPEVLGNAQVVQRFLREAQAAVRLKSEHVARVIDVGTLETGAPYMVLEYLEGCDLSQFPREELSTGLIVDQMLQACEALAEAHAAGIVHRDIKPANFFITRRAGGLVLKVLDFGISKTTSSTEQNLTATQAVMGTPAYMSPEQLRSTRDVDGRTDLWSLGVVMYELFEGIQPFQADTFSAFAIAIATEPPRPMTRQLPPGLANIVAHCLEKDRERRFRDVAELVRALAPFARSSTQAAITLERTGASSPAVAPTVMPGRSPGTLTGASGTVPGARAKRWPLFAVLGGLAAAGIGIAVVGTSGHETTPAAAEAPAPRPASTQQAAPPPIAPPAPPPPTTAPPPAPTAPTPMTTAPPEAIAAPVSAPAGSATTSAAPATAPHHAVAHGGKPAKPKQSGGSAASSSSDDDILGARH